MDLLVRDNAYLNKLEAAAAAESLDAFEPLVRARLECKNELVGLRLAMEIITARGMTRNVLPRIVDWAEDDSVVHPLARVVAGHQHVMNVSRYYIRHILANAFLGLYYGMRFTKLMATRSECGAHRLACLLGYFYFHAFMPDIPAWDYERPVTFLRHCMEHPVAWDKTTDTLTPGFLARYVHVHTKPMETFDQAIFVDFANRDLHQHEITPSCTQEEILFSVCPEAYVSMLLCDPMADNEVIMIHALRRYCDYEGYGDTFTFKGMMHRRRPLIDVLAMDAQVGENFERAGILRDLHKITTGFAACRGRMISTGAFGCGAFGGDTGLKFVQQVLAAAVTDTALQYSAFGDESLAITYDALRLSLAGKTVAEVVELVLRYRDDEYCRTPHAVPFAQWFLQNT